MSNLTNICIVAGQVMNICLIGGLYVQQNLYAKKVDRRLDQMSSKEFESRFMPSFKSEFDQLEKNPPDQKNKNDS